MRDPASSRRGDRFRDRDPLNIHRPPLFMTQSASSRPVPSAAGPAAPVAVTVAPVPSAGSSPSQPPPPFTSSLSSSTSSSSSSSAAATIASAPGVTRTRSMHRLLPWRLRVLLTGGSQKSASATKRKLAYALLNLALTALESWHALPRTSDLDADADAVSRAVLQLLTALSLLSVGIVPLVVVWCTTTVENNSNTGTIHRQQQQQHHVRRAHVLAAFLIALALLIDALLRFLPTLQAFVYTNIAISVPTSNSFLMCHVALHVAFLLVTASTSVQKLPMNTTYDSLKSKHLYNHQKYKHSLEQQHHQQQHPLATSIQMSNSLPTTSTTTNTPSNSMTYDGIPLSQSQPPPQGLPTPPPPELTLPTAPAIVPSTSSSSLSRSNNPTSANTNTTASEAGSGIDSTSTDPVSQTHSPPTSTSTTPLIAPDPIPFELLSAAGLPAGGPDPHPQPLSLSGPSSHPTSVPLISSATTRTPSPPPPPLPPPPTSSAPSFSLLLGDLRGDPTSALRAHALSALAASAAGVFVRLFDDNSWDVDVIASVWMLAALTTAAVAWPVLMDAARILLQAAPPAAAQAIRARCQQVLATDGVVACSNMHVWEESAGFLVATLCLTVKPSVSKSAVLNRTAALFEGFVDDLTVQIES